jgi:hypothetical protein
MRKCRSIFPDAVSYDPFAKIMGLVHKNRLCSSVNDQLSKSLNIDGWTHRAL